MSKGPARRAHPELAPVYACWIPALQEIARRCGYALTIHGSLATDLDIFAVPWVEYPTTPEALILTLREAYRVTADYEVKGPEPKPHGRRAWSLYIGHAQFDISVIPTPGTLALEARHSNWRWRRVLDRWASKHAT